MCRLALSYETANEPINVETHVHKYDTIPDKPFSLSNLFFSTSANSYYLSILDVS